MHDAGASGAGAIVLSLQWLVLTCRLRAKREQLRRVYGIQPDSQGRNLALTVLYVPHTLATRSGFRDSGFGIQVHGVWFLVHGADLLVSGFGFWVPGFGLSARHTRAEVSVSGFCFRFSGSDFGFVFGSVFGFRFCFRLSVLFSVFGVLFWV